MNEELRTLEFTERYIRKARDQNNLPNQIKLDLSQFQINLTFQHWDQLYRLKLYTSFEMEQVLICPLKAVHLCLASNFSLTKNWARNANSIGQENLNFHRVTSKEKENRQAGKQSDFCFFVSKYIVWIYSKKRSFSLKKEINIP